MNQATIIAWACRLSVAVRSHPACSGQPVSVRPTAPLVAKANELARGTYRPPFVVPEVV